MLNKPVLFMTFARPEYARQVWDAIKACNPKVLYFYSNKARQTNPEEVKNNEKIRSFVHEINWDCDIHTWFREEYVDIYSSLKGAISWLFENETDGIILEEDCVPTKAFFSYCEKLLDYYRDEKKVWCISGDNYIDYSPKHDDYFFSHYHFMFGWASWADRWKQIQWENIPIDELSDEDFLTSLYHSKQEAKYRIKEIKRVRELVIEKKCWDFAWGIVIDYHQGLTIQPREHLITCVGLLGTHSKQVKRTIFHKSASPMYEDYEILNHPKELIADYEFDHAFFKEIEKHMRIVNRIYRRLYANIVLMSRRFFSR